MEHGKVYTDGVTVGERLRPLDGSKVDGLAESMQKVGLLQPIMVWTPDNEQVVLVAGHHRLAAARKLGWDEIDCLFVVMDEINRELAEIDENLIRAELSPAQIADHLKRRRDLWEARGGKIFPTGFARETAERTGQTKRNVNLSIARAEAIPDIKQVSGTSLDKGVELDALAKMPEAQQGPLIARAKAGETVSARDVADVEEQQYKSLMSAWNRAGQEARERFLETIDTPVFDRTRAA